MNFHKALNGAGDPLNLLGPGHRDSKPVDNVQQYTPTSEDDKEKERTPDQDFFSQNSVKEGDELLRLTPVSTQQDPRAEELPPENQQANGTSKGEETAANHKAETQNSAKN